VKAKTSAIGVSQYKNKEFMVTRWLRNPGKVQLAPSLRPQALADSPEVCFCEMLLKEERLRILTACLFLTGG